MARKAKRTSKRKQAPAGGRRRRPAKPTRRAARRSAKAAAPKTLRDKFTLDAMPDTVDFRDRMFVPTLVEVPTRSNLSAYRGLGIPVLDQGQEGACVGYGIATMANFLLRKLNSNEFSDWISPSMLYAMAKRYDEWRGEAYEGSSARGGMKGWHKHGVCTEEKWPRTGRKSEDLTEARASDALNCLLGAYFRVNHRDLVAMHAAITEVGVLFASASVHSGWDDVGRDGRIEFREGFEGGHAFAIVGYDRKGFWIQNSWGTAWGDRGLAHLTYDDWLRNGNDVWVARLGVPVTLTQDATSARVRAGATISNESYVYRELRNHIVTLENNGRLREKGTYGLTPSGLASLVSADIPNDIAARNWSRRRLMIYAHGGLTSEDQMIQHVANRRQGALDAEVFPLNIIWRSDALSTIGNILQDAINGRRTEGVLESAKNFMLDRIDDTLEPLARNLGGKALWDEMKENATLASTTAQGGARHLAQHVRSLVANGLIDEVSLVGFSAGAVLLAPFVRLLTAKGSGAVSIKNLTLWAPACTMDVFDEFYLPLIKSAAIQSFDLYTLTDAVERDDDCARIYNKSLLYLVSNAFEKRQRIPILREHGEPLLGMEEFIEKNAALKGVLQQTSNRWVLAPDKRHSDARHHGDFGSDDLTIRSTLARISGTTASKLENKLEKTTTNLLVRRERVERVERMLAAVPRKAAN